MSPSVSLQFQCALYALCFKNFALLYVCLCVCFKNRSQLQGVVVPDGRAAQGLHVPHGHGLVGEVAAVLRGRQTVAGLHLLRLLRQLLRVGHEHGHHVVRVLSWFMGVWSFGFVIR